jgi:hypothetical protein
MPAPDYLEVLVEDNDRRLRVPLRMETDRPRGFHDDKRMIAWLYWESGDLMEIQDTLHGGKLWPSNREEQAYAGRRDDLTVYFVRADTGEIKIGIATDPDARLRALQVGSPVKLGLLVTCPGGRPKEAEYHQRFAAHRLHGEWFEPHPDILTEIERLQEKSA